MKLMDILNEVEKLNTVETDEVLSEASKEKIATKYKKDRSKAFKVITGKGKVSKMQAKKALSNLKDDKVVEARNQIISAFMSGDIMAFRKLLKGNLTKETIDYMELLVKAHGGKDKLLRAAGNKKNFLKKALADIEGISEFAETEEDM